MNTSKDKSFRPWYKDYSSQWGEPWVFSQWTQESFVTHRRHILRRWMCQEQQQNFGTLIQIAKHILEFTGVYTKNFWTLWTRLARNMDDFTAAQNQWEFWIPGSSTKSNEIIHQLLTTSNIGYFGLIVNMRSASVMQPLQQQWSYPQKGKRCAWPTKFFLSRYGLYQVWLRNG